MLEAVGDDNSWGALEMFAAGWGWREVFWGGLGRWASLAFGNQAEFLLHELQEQGWIPCTYLCFGVSLSPNYIQRKSKRAREIHVCVYTYIHIHIYIYIYIDVGLSVHVYA